MFKQTRKGLIRKFKTVLKGMEKELKNPYPVRVNLKFYTNELQIILALWAEYDIK